MLAPTVSLALALALAAGGGKPAKSKAGKEGTIDMAEAGRVFGRGSHALVGCFQALSARKPSAGGMINLKLVINEKGEVADASFKENTVNDKGFNTCVLDMARQWVFPKPTGGSVTLNFPIGFDARKKPTGD